MVKYNIIVLVLILAVCVYLAFWNFNALIPFLVTFAFILGLLFALFIGIHIYAYLQIWFSGLRLRKALQIQNRLISLGEAKEKIRNNQGKIIVDAPTLGWNVSRVWWSSRVDFAPRPESWDKAMLCPQEDVSNYSKFIDQTTGTAKLIDAFVISQRCKVYLKKHFGSDDCGFVFTGGVLFQQEIAKRKNGRNNQ